MADWDGRGLPPVAAARLERARRSGVKTSLLSVPAHTGVMAAGFTPVGEVMGCIVAHLGWSGYGGCGWAYGMAPPQYTITSTNSRGYFGFGPYVDAKRSAWASAINRMLAECAALGGDGVVGVRLTESDLTEGNREFVALGTAVRSQGQHPAAPDATHSLPGLSGARPASLTSFAGKVVVLNFWASWCEPCQVEAPLLERAQNQLQRHDATVLGVTYLDASPDSESFVRRYHLTYPNLRDNNGNFAHSYGTDQLPESFVIDRHGHIVAISRGEIDQAFLNRAIAMAVSS